MITLSIRHVAHAESDSSLDSFLLIWYETNMQLNVGCKEQYLGPLLLMLFYFNPYTDK